MKILYVGDPHATADALEEMDRLIDFVIRVATDENVDQVVFLGDQYHTHSIIQLSVMAFWDRAFTRMVDYHGLKVTALVGNHDKTGVKTSTEHALMLHHQIRVINQPQVANGVLFLPYMHDPQEFVQACRDAYPTTTTVVCHQTFLGSFFENGMLVPDGVDPKDIPQNSVISGHIHTPQGMGTRVWYMGAPRWRSVSDANVERQIWVVRHGPDGAIEATKQYSTAGVCRPIYLLLDTPAAPVGIPEGGAKVIVDVRGPSAYVTARVAELEAAYPSIRVRPFPDTERVARVRESDGIPKAFRTFLAGFKSKNGTSPEELWTVAQARLRFLGATVPT